MKSKLISALTPVLFTFGCASSRPPRSCRPENFKWGTKEFTVNVSRYGGNLSDKSIIIVPPTGRTNYIDRKYAEQCCAAGFDAYVMDSWTGDIEKTIELEIHQRFYGNAQVAISHVLDQIKSPYIGLMGTSVGGLHAAIAASYQDRLQAVFVIAGGIPIAEVIVDSDQKAMVNLRKDRQEKYGFKTGEENISAIQKVFEYEPMKLPPKYKEKDLGVSVGLKDDTVPTATQTKLEEFWKPQNSHFWTIVKTWLFKSSEVLEFFENSYESKKPKS